MSETTTEASPAPDHSEVQRNKRTVGTLTYTKLGLVVLFAWLLWGDFCFTIMEKVLGALLPIQLKSIGADNKMLALMVVILPNILGLSVGPAVSYKSDRYRSRWGRRIPFIVWTMPFLCMFLAGIGFTEDIADAMRNAAILKTLGITPHAATMILVGLMVLGFAFFNEFVNSVFWYLFADVVPHAYLGRFMGLMRVMGSIAIFIFQFYLAPYAETHAREIYIIVSLLYFFGFGLMCWRVKEGEYPPEEDDAKDTAKNGGSTGVLSHIGTYLQECFLSHPIYIVLFISTFFSGFMAVGVYGVFFAKQIGVSVENYFVIAAWFSLAGAICHYPAGMLADRFHPVRLTLIFAILSIPGSFLGFFYKVDLPSYILVAVLWFPVAELVGAASGVLLIRVLPRKRYGQFASANGMFKQAGKMLGVYCAAAFLDYVQDYRYYLIWSGVGHVVNALLIGIVYLYWCKLGGDNYVAPLREASTPDRAPDANGGAQ